MDEPGQVATEPIWPCTAWGLPCPRCHHRSGGLLPHLFTLTWEVSGGIFSVALSVGSPPLPVRKHAALWCSDFPPSGSSPKGDHPLYLPDL